MKWAARIGIGIAGTLILALSLASYWGTLYALGDLTFSDPWFYAKGHTSLLRDVVMGVFWITLMLSVEEHRRLGRVGNMASVWRATTIVALIGLGIVIVVDILYLRASAERRAELSKILFQQWARNVGLVAGIGFFYHFYLRRHEWTRCQYCAERIRIEATICRYCKASNPVAL